MAAIRFTTPETSYLLWTLGRAAGRTGLSNTPGFAVLSKILRTAKDDEEIHLTGAEMDFLLNELGRQYAERFSLPKSHADLIQSRHAPVFDKINAARRTDGEGKRLL